MYSPSIYAFKPVYLTARGRRTLLFFPDEYRHGCNVRGTIELEYVPTVGITDLLIRALCRSQNNSP